MTPNGRKIIFIMLLAITTIGIGIAFLFAALAVILADLWLSMGYFIAAVVCGAIGMVLEGYAERLDIDIQSQIEIGESP